MKDWENKVNRENPCNVHVMVPIAMPFAIVERIRSVSSPIKFKIRNLARFALLTARFG